MNHAKKHNEIMKKLLDYSDEEVIEYFRYENMQKSEPDFCPLYAKNKKCHDLAELNCYFCGCNNFRFNDDGFEQINDKTLKSYCGIDSKDGSVFEGKDALHQNCSACTVPHHEFYIKKNFKRDWLAIMANVDNNTDSD